MTDQAWDVIVIGSGNAGLCAGIAACEEGARVLVLEKAEEPLAGGNTKYTAGAMRFAYDDGDELLPLLADPDDPRLMNTDFGSYSSETFSIDLLKFNQGRPLSDEQRKLVDRSLDTLTWLADKGVRFEPTYERQSFLKDGKYVFWGGLSVASRDEGVGLFEQERNAFLRLGGSIQYGKAVLDLLVEGDRVVGVKVAGKNRHLNIRCGAVVLACGGFEANSAMRVEHLGEDWAAAKVRGTPHNTGDGLKMAFALGAKPHGLFQGCHATPMDFHMPDYGNLDLEHGQRKNYRKICYFLGVMLNSAGNRFVDEGEDFRNYTYAQFGRSVLEQPGHVAWQIFDSKVFDLLYGEYHFHDAHFVEDQTLDGLIGKLEGVDQGTARQTIAEFNNAVDDSIAFDPTIKDGKVAIGVVPPRSNWAQRLDRPPYRAYPVTGGITFTYGGLKLTNGGGVERSDGQIIDGLFACGELVGGVFFNGYPGGSGLTSGAVFGRQAGYGAAERSKGARTN